MEARKTRPSVGPARGARYKTVSAEWNASASPAAHFSPLDPSEPRPTAQTIWLRLAASRFDARSLCGPVQTGQTASCKHLAATEPNNSRRHALKPCVGIMMRSGSVLGRLLKDLGGRITVVHEGSYAHMPQMGSDKVVHLCTRASSSSGKPTLGGVERPRSNVGNRRQNP